MRLISYLLGFFLFFSCSADTKKSVKENIALEEIIYLRTEGLIILEKVLNQKLPDDAHMIGIKIKNFYETSQPYLVEICKDKNLRFTLATYKEINQEVEKLIQGDSSYSDFLLDKLLINLNQQKSFYLQILEDRDLAELHYYTLDSYLQVVCYMDDIKFLLEKTLQSDENRNF